MLIAIVVLQVVLVDGDVCQMDVLVGLVRWIKRVWLCGESSESFFVDEDLKRVERGHQYVDPEVKLVAIQQERVLDVALHDHGLAVGHLRDIVDNTDTSTSTLGCRFHDPVIHLTLLVLQVAKRLQEGDIFLGQDKGQRHNIEAVLGFT